MIKKIAICSKDVLMKFFNDKKKNLIIAFILLMFISAFSVWAAFTEPIGFRKSGANAQAFKAEQMSISKFDAESGDESSSGKGSESGSSGEDGKNKSQQENKERQEPEKEQEQAPGESIRIEAGKGGLDGISNSDKATDKEGGGNVGKPSIIPQENDGKLKIVTDLRNADIVDNQLENDDLDFYAYLENASKKAKLKVRIRNSQTGENGKYLKADGKNYKVHLTRGKNIITLIVKENGKTTHHVSFVINLTARKADADNPQVGKHPPVIKAWIDNEAVESSKIETKNRNFTIIFQATTHKGLHLPYDNIRVTFDGKPSAIPTGTHRYEYSFYLENPSIGDESHHKITVTAWDDEGNSSFKSYDLTYHFVDSGDVIGKCYVTIDATTIGLGILNDGFEYDVRQDEPASYAILAALDYYGYNVEYSGTKDSGFYLKGIEKGGIAESAGVPQNLAEKVVEDGISDFDRLAEVVRDSIAQFQYSNGSGWMYTIDGVNYPGRGMSEYFLNGHNNHITLRYTLSYGKDLGLTVTNPPTKLSNYCGIWINGGYEPRHSFGDWKVVKEAGCEEEGLMERVCQICGTKETKTIPKLSHNWVETDRKEPTETEDGYVEYKCSVCGNVRREILPKRGNP